MSKIFEKPIISIVLLAVMSYFLFFYGLGAMALTDPDETFYAQTAKEMLERNEWSTPYLYGKPQFEKPILFYMLVEMSYRFFGVNEFAARLPSAVFAFLGLVALYLLGSILFNRRVGFLAALVLGASIEYLILGRACITDMVLGTYLLIGFLFFFIAHIKKLPVFYVLSSAVFAKAVLTKGPVFIVLACLTILIYLVWAKELKSLKKMPLLWMAAAFLLVALPWYMVSYKLHGMAFIDEFFGFHNINRFTQSEHKIGSEFYYNIPILFGGLAPWSVFLPAAIWHLFKKMKGAGPERKGLIFVISWFAVIFGFFTVSSTKLPTYIFPAFFSAALVVAVFFDDYLTAPDKKPTATWFKYSYYFLVLGILIAAIVTPIVIYQEYPVATGGSILAAIFFVFGMLVSLFAFLKGKRTAAIVLVAYAFILCLNPVKGMILPEIERYETSKPIALKLKTMMKPEERIGSESNFLAGLAFYTGKFPVDLDIHQNLVWFMESKDRVWAVIKEKNHRQLYELATEPFCMKASYMVYKIGKRAIVTNIEPEDGVYLARRERKL